MFKLVTLSSLVLAVGLIQAADDFYEQCGKTATCFGDPSGCVKAKSCSMVVAIQPEKNGTFRFEAQATNIEEKEYVAVGLSEDNKMGKDSVTACITWNSEPRIENSWNPATYNIADNITGIQPGSKEYQSKTLRCSWTRDVVTETNGMTFNLSQPYYLLLARGPIKNEKSLSRHTSKTLTKSALDLNQISGDVASDNKVWLVKVHASFMVIAWIGGVSVAILMPRFFRESWKGKQLLGTDPWFAVHRGLMIVSVIFAKVAFLCIVIKVGGLRFPNLHQYFGLAAFILMFIQPIMATFRCASDADNRWIFNWCHRIVGNLAHLTAIVTIYFASAFDLVKDTYFLWNVFSFVAIYVLFFLILEFYPLIASRRRPDNVTSESQRIRELMLRVFIGLDIIFVISILYEILL